jgi:hypothetical protein
MPEEYQSGNSFGGSAPSEMPDDFEPSSADIDHWQNEGGPGPTPEPVETPESDTEPAPQDKEEGDQSSFKDRDKKQGKPPVQKKQTPLQEHREVKQFQHEKNELHKQVRLLSKEVRDLKAEKLKRDQGLDKTPEDWYQLANQFEQYGDMVQAQSARAEGDRLKVAQQQFQQSEWFTNTWHSNEAEIVEADPDFFNPETETGKRMNALFNDPKNADLAARYKQHPDGIWAAYHRVKAEYATELIPKLVQYIELLKGENERFKKSQSPMASRPSSRSVDPKSLSSMSEDEIEAAAMKEMQAIDGR